MDQSTSIQCHFNEKSIQFTFVFVQFILFSINLTNQTLKEHTFNVLRMN